ncbi:MAG: PASTA domain-containing protein [Alphaproteobacteria bacterium]|nr:PASTA domain-containing protein [Alphaproteobacteria bacterium]
MPTFDAPTLLDALSAPVGDLISSVGESVASAQRDLDAATIAHLRQIYAADQGFFHELQRIGYRPTWYHIPEVEAELQIALKVTGTHEESGGARSGVEQVSRVRMYGAPADAGYTNRFNYELTAASKVKFRIVPVPESPAMEQIRVVPAVTGLTVQQAVDRLNALGVPHQRPEDVKPTAIVTAQSPAAGELLEGNVVELKA